MQRSLFLLLVTVGACGGKPSTTPIGTNDTGGPGSSGDLRAPELWAAVMKPAATFTFVDRLPQGDEEFNTVEATVAEVQDIEGGKVATIDWKLNGEPLEATNLPRKIHVTTDKVAFQTASEEAPSEESTWSAVTVVMDDDHGDWSRYIHDGGGNLAGEKCYGLGPGKDSGECEDICEVQVCVHPKHGLTGGFGTWWPDTTEYFRRDLSK